MWPLRIVGTDEWDKPPSLKDLHMPYVVIRDAVAGDFETICALNLAEVQQTSPMDVTRLVELNGLSCYHKVADVDGKVSAFILGMRNGALYRNDNFEWFAGRYAQFIYVDRIVVSSAFRGLRLGTRLYEDLFRHARSLGIPQITCEYNIVPPNESSRLFHVRFGFKEQGTQWVANGTKRVSLQVAKTTPSV
jgi:predicted GNAT superfamily acetyltransferase